MTHARTLALVIAAAAAITTIAPAGAADLLKLTVGQRPPSRPMNLDR